MKVIALIVMVVVFAIPATGWAASCASQDTRRIKVDVTRDMGRVVYDFRRSQAELKRMSGQNMSSAWRVNGLTEGTFTSRSSARFTLKPSRKGRYYCVRLNSVALKVGLDRIVVYIANKYRRNSCPFRAVMSHEQEHVEINRRVLRRVGWRIDEEVRRAVYRFRPFPVRSEAEAQRKLSKYFEDALNPLFRELNAQADAENARIDTEANYKHLSKQCDRW